MTLRWGGRRWRVFPVQRPAPTPATPQGRCLAKGDDDDEVRDVRAAFGFTAHLRGRGEEAKALKQDIGFRARRWVVERTHRGMNRVRRVRIRWDKHVRNDLGCLHVACAYITSRQSGLLG
jgi:putative transposase